MSENTEKVKQIRKPRKSGVKIAKNSPKTLLPSEVLDLEGYYGKREISKHRIESLNHQIDKQKLKFQVYQLSSEKALKDLGEQIATVKAEQEIMKAAFLESEASIRTRLSLSPDQKIAFNPETFELKE